MAVTDPLILPADVLLIPVADLAPEVRKQFEAEDDDYAITRPRSRAPSKIVDATVAALLGEFRVAKTIVDAVISYSHAHAADPGATLEAAFPVLDRFIKARILVPAASQEAQRIDPVYGAGDRVDGFELIGSVQVLDDSDLYKARADDGTQAALKIARPGRERELEETLIREADVLRRLDGRVNPRLLAHGVFQGHPYLAIGWRAGVPADAAASDIRREHGTGAAGRTRLVKLCVAILDAYAHLHGQGLIHGDVHPRNVLIDRDGAVSVIDFGLARFDDDSRTHGVPPRGGVGFFFEPEFARARLRGRQLPSSTFAGEQHALAALLYLLLSGGHYLDFSAEKRELLRQIAEDPPRPFDRRGAAWPDVEVILERALRKRPEERFPSVSEFAGELRTVQIPADVSADGAAGSPVVAIARDEAADCAPLERTAADALVDEVLSRVAADGPLFTSGLPAPPFSSINYGMAGIGFALYRLASVRDDARLLALADLWSTRAAARMGGDDAFYNPGLKITRDTVGRIALYHTASGVHAVQAIIAHAMGDVVSEQTALDAFVASGRGECASLDLTLGHASVLLGCTLLADLPVAADWLNRQPMMALGVEILDRLWAELDAMSPVGTSKLRYLGIAHGWAGILYATLRWCRSTGGPLNPRVRERLDQLAAHAESTGRGIRWPILARRSGRDNRPEQRDAEYMAGWCNGSAGHVFLWSLAHELLSEERYLRLAESAAWDAFDHAIDFDSLCCGLAGCGYALLEIYRRTDDPAWLRRSEHLTNRAVSATRSSAMRDSLYKGTLGVAVLAADLSDPRNARMPLFESEAWPSTRR